MEGGIGREILKAKIVVMGIETVDSSPGLMLVCDDKSYMINCGEGTQRLCEEYKIKLPKLSHAFFTRLDWSVLGGFPGMLLTMSDIGGEELGVHGPPGTLNFVSSLRYFVRRPDLALRIDQTGQLFEDANVTIRGMFIKAQGEEEQEEQQQECPANQVKGGWVAPLPDGSFDPGLGKRRQEGAPKPPKQQKKMAPPMEEAGRDVPEESHPMNRIVPSTQPRRVALCLDIKLADVRGKFDVERAKALGIPPGKAYAELVKGNAVAAPNGRVVTPQECLGPNTRGTSCLVLDCPDESFAAALFAAPQIQESLGRADFVFHFCKAEVFLSNAYSEWIERYAKPNCRHYALNRCGSQLPVFRSAAAVQSALSGVSNVFFKPLEEPRPSLQMPKWCMSCNIGDTFTLAPAKMVGFQACPPRAPMAIKLPDAGKDAYSLGWDAPDQSPEFGFLGTGASRPSKYRNVTSQFVFPGQGRGFFLFDCGEGTLGQIRRLMGPKADQALRSLRCIAVSHLHADHHLGLTSLLGAASRLRDSEDPPVHIVAPAPLRFWAEEMQEWHLPPEKGWPIQWHDCMSLPEDLAGKLRLDLFSAVSVIHCPLSYGFVLDWEVQVGQKFRFVYSGDTRPCERLEVAGRDADLLIHEATFEDSMHHDAHGKRHSTISEAVASAQRMGAKHVVLTHFSQRYPKTIAETGPNPVAMAWDMMCFQPRHFADLPHLSGLARNVFDEDDEEEANGGVGGENNNDNYN